MFTIGVLFLITVSGPTCSQAWPSNDSDTYYQQSLMEEEEEGGLAHGRISFRSHRELRLPQSLMSATIPTQVEGVRTHSGLRVLSGRHRPHRARVKTVSLRRSVQPELAASTFVYL